MMKRISILSISLFFFSMLTFTSYAADFALPSGKILKNVSISKATNLREPPVLVLSYETDLDMDDKKSLRKEVEEIWPTFRNDVNREKMDVAAIKAMKPGKTTGFIIKRTEGRSHSYLIRKRDNGTWEFYNWGRDYDFESSSLAEKFLENMKKSKFGENAKLMHYPSDFIEEQLKDEFNAAAHFLSTVKSKLGSLLSYSLNITPIKYRRLFYHTASPKYWNQYPFFNILVYNLKYSEEKSAYLIFRFSIIQGSLEINSIEFGFPPDFPNSKEIIKEIAKEVIDYM